MGQNLSLQKGPYTENDIADFQRKYRSSSKKKLCGDLINIYNEKKSAESELASARQTIKQLNDKFDAEEIINQRVILKNILKIEELEKQLAEKQDQLEKANLAITHLKEVDGYKWRLDAQTYKTDNIMLKKDNEILKEEKEKLSADNKELEKRLSDLLDQVKLMEKGDHKSKLDEVSNDPLKALPPVSDNTEEKGVKATKSATSPRDFSPKAIIHKRRGRTTKANSPRTPKERKSDAQNSSTGKTRGRAEVRSSRSQKPDILVLDNAKPTTEDEKLKKAPSSLPVAEQKKVPKDPAKVPAKRAASKIPQPDFVEEQKKNVLPSTAGVSTSTNNKTPQMAAVKASGSVNKYPLLPPVGSTNKTLKMPTGGSTIKALQLAATGSTNKPLKRPGSTYKVPEIPSYKGKSAVDVKKKAAVAESGVLTPGRPPSRMGSRSKIPPYKGGRHRSVSAAPTVLLPGMRPPDRLKGLAPKVVTKLPELQLKKTPDISRVLPIVPTKGTARGRAPSRTPAPLPPIKSKLPVSVVKLKRRKRSPHQIMMKPYQAKLPPIRESNSPELLTVSESTRAGGSNLKTVGRNVKPAAAVSGTQAPAGLNRPPSPPKAPKPPAGQKKGTPSPPQSPKPAARERRGAAVSRAIPAGLTRPPSPPKSPKPPPGQRRAAVAFVISSDVYEEKTRA